MRIRDWSSDVCSSDLVQHGGAVVVERVGIAIDVDRAVVFDRPGCLVILIPDARVEPQFGRQLKLIDRVKGVFAPVIGSVAVAERTLRITVDRKSVEEGKRVSVSVDLGGRRTIKKKHTT